MSGICGVVDFSGAPVRPEVLRAMTGASPHRGPDGTSFWNEGAAAFAHQALHATPESVRERQPLACDGICLTADARIDNRQELIPDLRSSWHLDSPEPTDAALILAAWRRWGVGAPLRLIGDFAYAVWDRRARTLFLVRDALGIRPLHYAVLAHGLVFASEAQQVLAHPEVPCRLDRDSVTRFLVGIRRESRSTMFLDVRRLLPGHVLVGDPGGIRTRRYWNPADRPVVRYRRDADYADHYLALLRRSVRDRLRTQGETVGVYMSGGLDSTSVAAVAKTELDAMDDAPRLVAQSYVFDEYKTCDEREHSARVAARHGFEIEFAPTDRRLILDPDPPLEGPELSWEGPDRILRERLADRGARVLLTGHLRNFGPFGHGRICGVDRLLAGQWGFLLELGSYGRERALPLSRVLLNFLVKPLLPHGLLRFLRSLRGHDVPPRPPAWLSPDAADRAGIRRRLVPPSGVFLLWNRRAPEARRQLMFLDDVGSAVYWHDRRAARNGMEARHPLLDRRLAEFLARLPSGQVFRPNVAKPLARRAMAGLLPESVRLRRDKTTFGEYLAASLRSRRGDLVRELLADPLLARMGFVDACEFRRAWSDAAADPSRTVDLWFPIAAEMWLREFSRWFS